MRGGHGQVGWVRGSHSACPSYNPICPRNILGERRNIAILHDDYIGSGLIICNIIDLITSLKRLPSSLG